MGFAKWTYVAGALAATALMSMPAAAAPVGPAANPPARGLLLSPLTLTKVQDLSFGTVATSPTSGTVAINATTGARTVAGGVTGLSSDIGQRAQFAGAGSPSQQVLIIVTPPTELTSVGGDTLPVLALTLDGPPIRTINPVTRSFFFGIGGVILVNADQPEGVYTSDYDVTVNYL